MLAEYLIAVKVEVQEAMPPAGVVGAEPLNLAPQHISRKPAKRCLRAPTANAGFRLKRRLLLAVLLAALCGLLCSCTRAANPLVQAEATPLPGVEQRLHAATAAEDNAASWDVVLYFRYLDYSMLAGESRTLTVRKDESSEAALVRALLAGPSAGEMNLRRALGEDVGLKEVTASGDMLFITLTNSLLRDGIPDGWRSDEFWAEEAPVRRRLAMASIADTVMENLPYTRVQILID